MAVQNVNAGELNAEGLAELLQVVLNHPDVTADVSGQAARFVARRDGAALQVVVAGWGEVFGRFRVTIEQVS